MVKIGTGLAAVAIVVVLYDAVLLRAGIKQLVQSRERTNGFLGESRDKLKKSREGLDDYRTRLEEIHSDSLEFREGHLQRALDNAQRAEELLRLQREQISLLKELVDAKEGRSEGNGPVG